MVGTPSKEKIHSLLERQAIQVAKGSASVRSRERQLPLDGEMVCHEATCPDQVDLLLRKLGSEELLKEKLPNGVVNSSHQTERSDVIYLR